MAFQNTDKEDCKEEVIIRKPLTLDTKIPHPNKSVSSRYTLLTFIPHNIFHQLSKPSTLFFSITLLLLCIPSISPFLPYSYMLAFFIVVGISMVKDGMEDLKRHRENRIFNNKECIVLIEENNNLVPAIKKVMDIDTGDFLYLKQNEYVPADVILLKGIHKANNNLGYKCCNHAFVDTSNLDGESNLKKKHCAQMKNLIKSNCKNNNVNENNLNMHTNNMNDVNIICDCLNPIINSLISFSFFNEMEYKITHKNNKNEQTNSQISLKNILLKGSSLKNTSYALCIVASVGKEEKDQNNRKSSIFEGELNYILKLVFVLYAIILAMTAFISSDQESNLLTIIFSNYIIFSYLIPLSLYVMLEATRMFHSAYIKRDKRMFSNSFEILNNTSNDSINSNISNDNILNNSINTSNSNSHILNNSINTSNTNDQLENINSVCRNSSVIEDLGNINYILTDKTGTLTKNAMTLKYIHGEFGEEKIKKLIKRIIQPFNINNTNINNTNINNQILFLLNLLICNSIEVLNKKYEGISQEELCILENLLPYNIKLLERDEEFVRILILNQEYKFNIIEDLEFSSSRQRQSIIVKLVDILESDLILNDKSNNELKNNNLLSNNKLKNNNISNNNQLKNEISKLKNKSNNNLLSNNKLKNNNISNNKQLKNEISKLKNKLILFTKGSDQKLLYNKNDKDRLAMEYLKTSNEYRSLVYKYREIEESEIIEFIKNWNLIKNGDFSHKEQIFKEEELFSKYENFMNINLKNNSTYLGSILIEDELQDNVFITINSLKINKLKIWMITGDKRETAICCGRNSGVISGEHLTNYLAISGKEAVSILENSDDIFIENELINIQDILKYPSIIIYRATPSQKGIIAKIMTQLNKHTLAIGDGNNDVGMIKESNVGVGIIGKEGNQASLNADFAIPCFSCLEILILNHGRYNLVRYSKMTVNAFYKNIFFIMIQFYYNFYNGGSAFPIYNDIFMNYYNLFYTSLIPFSIGLFDRDEEVKSYCEENIINNNNSEQLHSNYKNARIYFDKRIILANLIFAVVESIFVFTLIRLFLFEGISNSSGLLGGYSCESTLISILVFTTVILRQFRQISFFTIYSLIAILGSILFNLFVLFGVQQILRATTGSIYHLLKIPSFYFIVFSVISFVYFIDSGFEFIQDEMFNRIKKK